MVELVVLSKLKQVCPRGKFTVTNFFDEMRFEHVFRIDASVQDETIVLEYVRVSQAVVETIDEKSYWNVSGFYHVTDETTAKLMLLYGRLG